MRSHTSDLVPPGFRLRSEELRRSLPPRWMTWAWIGALLGTLLCLSLTLLGPMDEFVLAQGVVRPADYALVFPATNGTVARVEVASGDQVRTGAVLCRLDTTDLDQQAADLAISIAQARAALAIADAELAATRAAPVSQDLLLQARSLPHQREVVAMRRELLARMEQAGGEGGLPIVELTRERLGVKAAEVDLERAAQAATLLDGGYAAAAIAVAEGRRAVAAAHLDGLTTRLAHLEAERERRIVRAPADGQVVSRAVRFTGEQVALGTALFKIAKGSATQIRLYASEDRVDRIKPGMLVRFRSRSDPDRLSRMSAGRVLSVALDRDLRQEDAERPQDSGAYAIDVAVDDLTALPLGAAVDAEIVLEARPFWRLFLIRSNAE